MNSPTALKLATLRGALDAMAIVAATLAAPLLGAGSLSGAAGLSAAVFAVSAVVLLGSRQTLRRRPATGSVESCARAVGACAVAAMLAIAAAVIVGAQQPNALGLRLWLVSASCLCAVRIALGLAQRRARKRGLLTVPTLIIGAGAVGARVARRLVQHPSLGLQPIGFLDADPPAVPVDPELDLPVLGAPADAVELARETGARQIIVAFSLEPDHAISDAIRRCHSAGLAVSAVPRLYESITDRASIDHVGGFPLMTFEALSPRGWQFVVKDAIDRVAAGVALIALSPLMLAIMFAVRLSSHGPAVYRQRRIGRDGREFDLLKFRSMLVQTDADDFHPPAGLAPGGIEGTDRRTPFGRWLRNSSLDELPQLVNVLRGEMSLIGPRPERPEFAARFGDEIPRYADRHRVKPGITGWAQVNGLRGQTSIADRVEWDNHYIENWSLSMELRTLAQTVGEVLSFSGDGHRIPTRALAGAVSAGARPPAGRPDARRRALTLVSAPAMAGSERHWFCGYCGAAPPDGVPTPGVRVCGHCATGLLLEAPIELAPAAQEAFLVIDSRLTVQALSQRAEELLGVSEPDAIDHPISELLIDAAAEPGSSESFAAAITRARSAGGDPWSGFVRPRGAFGIRTRARVTPCGPGQAALIVFEPVAPRPPLRLIETAPAVSVQALS